MKGQVFTEGPRSEVPLAPGTGEHIHFQVTTNNPQAQIWFNQGVGMLHGFWNYEAERSFREVLKLDPNCVMANWGLSMANTIFEAGDPKRAYQFMKRAAAKKDQVSSREQLWIESLEALYSKIPLERDRHIKHIEVLQKIVQQYPDDLDAKAFLALQTWNYRLFDHFHQTREQISTLLDEIFAVEPLHPAHHYRVHLWDGKVNSTKALASAALLGPSAPGIAHMWHMGTHTYDSLNRHLEATWHLEASARVDHAQMARFNVLPYQIHNYFHNNLWLVRSYKRIGNWDSAIAVAKNLIELPQNPKILNGYGTESEGSGKDKLLPLLWESEQWDEVIRLVKTPYLSLSDEDFRYEGTLNSQRELRAIAHLYRGEKELALEAKKEIESAIEAIRLRTDFSEDFKKSSVKPMELALANVDAHLLFFSGEKKKAINSIVGFESNPKSIVCKMLLDAGEPALAEDKARLWFKDQPQQAAPLANLIYVLFKVGKLDEARVRFNELRPQSEYISLDLAPFNRLAEVATALSLPDMKTATDWRTSWQPPNDVTERMKNRTNLDELGPIFWSPQKAKPFAVNSISGETLSLEKYRGKPVLVVLFLTYGCLGCVKQLVNLEALYDRFNAAGISLIAISSQDVADTLRLNELRNQAHQEPFRIQLAADPTEKIFHDYHAYDDFEGNPIHGTFLIDDKGRIRWQDIGGTAFDDANFLLKESIRLLAIP